MPILWPVGPVLSAQVGASIASEGLGMVLEFSSALNGPFIALFAMRFCYECLLNGPFRAESWVRRLPKASRLRRLRLGLLEQPFRLEDGLGTW